MHDNFEKEVQKKLEEMEFIPSAPVWDKVEIEIKQRKKKRRGFFWLWTTVVVATCGAGWWGYKNFNQQNNQASASVAVTPLTENKPASPLTQPSNPLKIITPLTIDSITPADHAAGTSSGHHHSGTTVELSTQHKKPSGSHSQQGLTYQTASAKRNFINSKQQEKQATSSATSINFVDDKRNVRIKTNPSILSSANTVAKKPNEVNEVNIRQENEMTIKEEKAMPVKTNIMDSVTQAKPKQITSSLDSLIKPVSKDSAAIKIKVAKQNKKWQRQLLFSVGSNAIANKLGAYYLSNRGADFNNNTGGSTGSNIGNNMSYKRAPISSGISFATGYGVGKAMTATLFFKVGVQYAYYSFHEDISYPQLGSNAGVNDLNGNAVRLYYRTGSQQNYRTSLHVIELPIELDYKPILKWPISVAVGASYGRLIKSNALTFNDSVGVYYVDKANNRSNQCNLYASVLYNFRLKHKVKIQAGPYLQYSLTGLQKEGAASLYHLSSFGIKTSFFF